MGQLEVRPDFFRPFQAEIVLFVQFRIALGAVEKIVPTACSFRLVSRSTRCFACSDRRAIDIHNSGQPAHFTQ